MTSPVPPAPAETAPSGCHWCGVPKREHLQRWTSTSGWHRYAQPSQDLIKSRIRDRAAARAALTRKAHPVIPGYHGSVDTNGHATENTCPCPQEACGLIDPARALPQCIHHGSKHPPKPTAHGHPAGDCPGAPDPADIIIGPLYNATLAELTGRRAARHRVATRVLSALSEHGYQLHHQSTRPDHSAPIAAYLEDCARVIEDSDGDAHDWLAEQLADRLPTLAIGGAIQADPRAVAIEAYRAVAFVITGTGAQRSSTDAATPAPEAPEAPQDPEAGIPGSPDSAETITGLRDDQPGHLLNLLDALTDRLGTEQARTAIDIFATWARAQAAIAATGSSPRPAELKHNERAFRHMVRVMESYGATPPAPNRSELAAAVWCALADAGHTAATDSPTGDGYQIGHGPGAVLVTLFRGTGLNGTPWAATQRQTLQPWADSLTAAGFQVEVVGDADAPAALHVTSPAEYHEAEAAL